MTDQLDSLKKALAARYATQREIGSGGVAVVYLAHDLKLGRNVALKVLRPELAASLDAERFLREIEAAAALRHPNIVAIHDCGKAAGQLFYTMPNIEGESLRERLNREKQLPIDDALEITREVADALGYAHSMGVVHRDLTPENIFLTAGHAVVSDFGFAHAISEAGGEKVTETGTTVGTAAYQSPEQASGEDVDGRSDLYSLGCVLYELLSGDVPYAASTPEAVLAKKLHEPTPRISVVRETVPSGVEAALTKVLQKNPADRFVTAQQFVEALAVSSEAIAPSEGVAARRTRPVARWVMGLAMIGAIGVVAIVLFNPWGASAAGDDIDRLVVAPLENRTGDSAAADWGFLAAEFITRAVDQAAAVSVVPARAVRDLVRDVDPDVGMPLEEMARRTRARYAVTGSYALSADRVRFDVELVNTESGALERSLDPVSGPVDSLEAVFALLSERVTAATMTRLSPDLGPGWTWRHSSPPSLDALKALQATQDRFCSFRSQDAIEEARAGLQENPDYAPLLVMFAIALGNRGRNREADSILTIIESLTDQMTTVERLLAEWFHGNLHGDHAEATRAAEQLYRIQPSRYGFQAGWTLLRTNRFADALERCLAMDIDTPCYRTFPPWWSTTARAYHMLGRYQEELDLALEGLERFPSFRPAMYHVAIALAGLGRLDALDSLLDVVTGLPLDPGAMQQTGSLTYNPGTQTGFVALELNVLGRREASQRVMDRALAWFAGQSPSDYRFERAQAHYWAERWPDADTLFAALINEMPNNVVYRGHRGVALAHLGRHDEALEIDRWLQQADRPFLRGAHTRWRAAIAAALGDQGGAVRLLQQAYREGMVLGHAHRRDPEWRPLLDYRPYQEFVKPR